MDYEEEYYILKDRREIGHGEFVRFFGIYNNVLSYLYIMTRFFLIVYHLVWFYFETNVQLKRVMEIFNV